MQPRRTEKSDILNSLINQSHIHNIMSAVVSEVRHTSINPSQHHYPPTVQKAGRNGLLLGHVLDQKNLIRATSELHGL